MRLYDLFILVLLLGCSSANYMGDNLSLKEAIPKEVDGWFQDGDIEKYDRETIFRYMNGAGEIYRMYDYRGMEVLRMVKAGRPEIKIEMFDMGTTDDAFGVFSHMREGEEAGAGEGSEYRKGLLCFWQGKYFFCIISEQETAEIKRIIFELSKIITDAFKPSHKKPAILDILPEENLDDKTIRYFNLQSSLNYHYFVSEENILHLGKNSEGVLAKYGESYCYLLCIKYPEINDAKKAFDNFQTVYLPEGDRLDIYQFEENKWFASELLRNYIIIIFDAPTEPFAKTLKQKAVEKISLQ